MVKWLKRFDENNECFEFKHSLSDKYNPLLIHLTSLLSVWKREKTKQKSMTDHSVKTKLSKANTICFHIDNETAGSCRGRYMITTIKMMINWWGIKIDPVLHTYRISFNCASASLIKYLVKESPSSSITSTWTAECLSGSSWPGFLS